MSYSVPDSWEWFVTIIDRVGNVERQQDVTRWVNMSRSNFQPTTNDKVGQCRMFLSFPLDTPDLNIKELMEVWAGWRDRSTRRPVKAWFGGYINKQTGSVNGGEHTIDVDLVDYGLLLTATQVRGWPTLPVDESVMPPGLTIAEWLEGGGGNPYQGLIPMHLHFVATRVGNEFANFIIPAWAMPGNADDVPGRWGYVSLRKICEDLVDVMRFINLGVRPAFWMRAITAGGRVVPQFNFADLSLEDQTPRLYFSFHPAAGETQILMPFTHERDATTVRTRVTVKGEGAVTETGPIIEATTFIQAHAEQYPTYYQVEPGWAGAPIVDLRIDSLEKAQRIADAIETQQWGALGIITFTTDEYVEPGWFVQVTDPVELANPIIQAVTEVTIQPNPGYPLFQIKIGRSPIDLNDILRGGTIDQPVLEGDAGWKTGGAGVSGTPAGRAGGASAPGMPRNSGSSVARVAVSDNQNVVKPQFNDVTAWVVSAARKYRPDPLTGQQPVDPAPPDKNVITHLDSLGNLRNWAGPDLTDHPHHYVIPVSAPSTIPIQIPDPCKLVVESVKNTDGSTASGVTTSYKLNGAAVPNPTSGTPIIASRYDVLLLTVGGSLPADGVSILLSEAPDVVLP